MKIPANKSTYFILYHSVKSRYLRTNGSRQRRVLREKNGIEVSCQFSDVILVVLEFGPPTSVTVWLAGSGKDRVKVTRGQLKNDVVRYE